MNDLADQSINQGGFVNLTQPLQHLHWILSLVKMIIFSWIIYISLSGPLKTHGLYLKRERGSWGWACPRNSTKLCGLLLSRGETIFSKHLEHPKYSTASYTGCIPMPLPPSRPPLKVMAVLQKGSLSEQVLIKPLLVSHLLISLWQL